VPSGYFCVGRRKYEVRINPSTVRTCRSRFHRRGTGVGRFGISTAWMFNECTHRHLVYYPQWRDTDGPTHSGHLKNDKRWRPVAVGVGRVVGMISLEGGDSHIVREATMWEEFDQVGRILDDCLLIMTRRVKPPYSSR
jgi:hypothetical protein